MQITITPLRLIIFVALFALLVHGATELMDLYWDWRNSVEDLSM